MPIFILSILVGIPLLSLVWWWWADRRLGNMNAGRGLRVGLTVAVILLLTAFCWVVFARREIVTVSVPAPLYALVLLWGLICLPFLGLPSMLGWSFWKIVKTLLQKPAGIAAREERPWTRREWLKSAVVALPVMTTFGAGGVSLPMMTRFRVREMTVTLRDLPPELDGLRIAHLTDTHVGKFTKGKVLDELVAATNRLKADLVLFTGDLIDNTIRDLPEAVRMLQGIEQKLFVIEGNHDLFDDPAGFEREVREGGIALLRNEATTVEIRGVAVQILGLVWNRGENEMARDVEAMATLRDPSAFPILLAHHPHVFDRAAELGFPLTLAGHTHGGQFMMTREVGAGPAMFRYWSGLYQRGKQALVVSNGAGNWFPLRVNSPAEIVHLTLQRERVSI
jgi:predicted MPP superfamily phosphohydrolase